MTRILLVRHAQSEWNAVGRWQGWADPPLSALGRSQAATAARRLLDTADLVGVRPATVVASDLQRAATTATALAGVALPGTAIKVDPAWREYRVGAWSGLTRSQIEQRWPGLLGRWDLGELHTPPGGEPREDFDARLSKALDRVASDAGEEGECLVVSHGGVIRAIARRLGQPAWRVGNLAGLELKGAAGDYEIRGFIDLLAPPRCEGASGKRP